MTACRHDNITTLTNDGIAGRKSRSWACSQCGVRFADLDTLDEERLARALEVAGVSSDMFNAESDAAAIVAAYREDTDGSQPDPNRKGMPKCPKCGDIAFRPDPVDWRKPAWRCGGCLRVLGRCNCDAKAYREDTACATD